MSYTTVAVTPGAGANINVDRISSNDYQRVKRTYGQEGLAADVVSTYHLVTAASTNAARIKSGASCLLGVSVFSLRATPLYIKFHDTNSSPPTAGSGVTLVVGVQAGTQRDFLIPGGRAFTSGLGITVVTGIADSDSAAVALNDAVIEVFYV